MESTEFAKFFDDEGGHFPDYHDTTKKKPGQKHIVLLTRFDEKDTYNVQFLERLII